MKCIYCRGEMRRGKVPFHAERKGVQVRWEAVPAWVCPQCGEAYFEEEQVAVIQQMLQNFDQYSEKLAGTV